jgi:hypothetical protein
MTPDASHWQDLRLSVLAVGAQGDKPWWKLPLFTETAPRSLGMVFPRTTANAMATAATEIARLVHEHGIGRGRVFHLFQMPSDLEFRIGRAALSLEVDHVTSLMDGKTAATRLLEFSEGKHASAAEGPRHAGSVEDLVSGSALSQLAALYHDAHQRGLCCLPYFE